MKHHTPLQPPLLFSVWNALVSNVISHTQLSSSRASSYTTLPHSSHLSLLFFLPPLKKKPHLHYLFSLIFRRFEMLWLFKKTTWICLASCVGFSNPVTYSVSNIRSVNGWSTHTHSRTDLYHIVFVRCCWLVLTVLALLLDIFQANGNAGVII